MAEKGEDTTISDESFDSLEEYLIYLLTMGTEEE